MAATAQLIRENTEEMEAPRQAVSRVPKKSCQLAALPLTACVCLADIVERQLKSRT